MLFFKEFYDELKKEVKVAALSIDGTVNELTSVVKQMFNSFIQDTQCIEEID